MRTTQNQAFPPAKQSPYFIQITAGTAAIAGLGVALAIIQQVTGINTVIYYAPTIFQEAGFHSDASALIATAGVGVVNMLMTVVAIPLLDRLGRRPLLLASLGGMALSLVALALGFAIGGVALKWIGVLSLALYIASFAIGLGPIFWLLIQRFFRLKSAVRRPASRL